MLPWEPGCSATQVRRADKRESAHKGYERSGCEIQDQGRITVNPSDPADHNIENPIY